MAWLVFEVLVFLQLVLYPTSVKNTPISTASVEHGLFLYLAPLSPALTILILYSRWIWTGVLFAQRRWPVVGSLVRQFQDGVKPLSARFGRAIVGPPLFGSFTRLAIAVAVIFAGFVGYFPYRVDLNPGGVPVGLDVNLYISWLSQMVSKPVASALGYAFNGPGPSSRPLLLVALYSVASVSSLQPDLVIKILPVFLAMGLVGSSYLFVRLGGAGEEMAILTASLTAGSFAITVGIWASYYANWLALIEAYLFLGVFLRSIRSHSNLRLEIQVALSIAILLTHPWTWILVTAITSVFIASRWKLSSFWNQARSTFLVIFAGGVVELVKTLVLGAFGAPAAGAYLIGQTPNPLGNLVQIWPNTVDAVLLTYNGLLATTILFGLALLYVLRLRKIDDFQRLLLAWVMVTSVLFPFFSGYLQSRLVYDMPISVLAAGGLMMIASRLDPRGLTRLSLVAAIVLLNLNYALWSMLII